MPCTVPSVAGVELMRGDLVEFAGSCRSWSSTEAVTWCMRRKPLGSRRRMHHVTASVDDLEVGVDRTVARLLLRLPAALGVGWCPAPAPGRRGLLVERLRGLHPRPRQLEAVH